MKWCNPKSSWKWSVLFIIKDSFRLGQDLMLMSSCTISTFTTKYCWCERTSKKKYTNRLNYAFLSLEVGCQKRWRLQVQHTLQYIRYIVYLCLSNLRSHFAFTSGFGKFDFDFIGSNINFLSLSRRSICSNCIQNRIDIYMKNGFISLEY